MQRLALLGLMLFSIDTMADAKADKTHDLDIQQQSVAKALTVLSEQTDVQVFFPYNLTKGKTANAVKGNFTVLQAVDLMLDGSGLHGVISNEGVLTIFEGELKGGGISKGEQSMQYKKVLVAATVAFFSGGGGQVALAQNESDETGSDRLVLEEVVVTASKRILPLQDTALSVSAVTGADIKNLGVSDYDQILGSIPGVSIIEAGPGNSKINIRGVGSLGGTSTSSFYIDEFPLAGNAFGNSTDIKLVDLEQIEVLKGPQGTLYGQSALGGVVRYITNKPTTDAIEGGVDLTAETVEDGGEGYKAQGYINIPLSDTLAARAVVYDYDRAGFIDNHGTGTDDVNSEEVTGGRLALRWEVTDNTSFDLLYLNQTATLGGGQGNDQQTITSTFTPIDTGLPTDIGPQDLDNPSFHSNLDPYQDSSFEVVNMKLDVSFEHFDLNLMFATQERENGFEWDFSPWLGLYDDVSVLLTHYDYNYDTDTFEARLVSTGDGPVDWIFGVWYEDQEGERTQRSELATPRVGTVVAGLEDGDVWRDFEVFEDREELSIYGELGYQFNDQAKLTLGYRRADMKLDSGMLRADGIFDGGNAATIGTDSSTQEDVDTYKVNFEYIVNDDVLVYALASSGYRPGGFNRTGDTGSPFKSDTLWNYELGARTSWLENRLTANVVAYYIDWTDIQIRQFDPDLVAQTFQNAGEAEVYGLEMELQYIVADGLQLTANYGYVDATLAKDYIKNPPEVAAASGDTLPRSSEHNLYLHADWQKPLTSDLDLLFNATYRYRSSFPTVLESARRVDTDRPDSPSFEIVTLSVGLSYQNGVTASLFANNVFDERVVQYSANLGDLRSTVMGRPRTIGLRVGYDF